MRGVVATLHAVGKLKKSLRKHRMSHRVVEQRKAAAEGAIGDDAFWKSNPAAGKEVAESVMGARIEAVEIEMSGATRSPAKARARRLSNVALALATKRSDSSSKKSATKTMRVMKNNLKKNKKASKSKNQRKHFTIEQAVVTETEPKDDKGGAPEHEDGDLRAGGTSAFQRAKLSGKTLSREVFEESESGRVYVIDTIDGVDQPAHWILNESIHLDATTGQVYLYDEKSGAKEGIDDYDLRLDGPPRA